MQNQTTVPLFKNIWTYLSFFTCQSRKCGRNYLQLLRFYKTTSKRAHQMISNHYQWSILDHRFFFYKDIIHYETKKTKFDITFLMTFLLLDFFLYISTVSNSLKSTRINDSLHERCYVSRNISSIRISLTKKEIVAQAKTTRREHKDFQCLTKFVTFSEIRNLTPYINVSIKISQTADWK